MDRNDMIDRVGKDYKSSNIEGGEYSYVKEAGSKKKLIKALGYEPEHWKLDLRFENENGIVVLIETKPVFVDSDIDQLQEYLAEERALHIGMKIIAVLANTTDDKVRVWQSEIDDEHLLKEETVLDSMEHYERLFTENNRQNNKEAVLKNTYMLNGKGITQDEISENEGAFIAVQSGEDNNGVMGKIDLDYCRQMNYTISERPCLTVARSGSAGFVSFQVDGCVVGDSAKILLLPESIATTKVYLFMQTILTANRFKYTYGRKVTEDKYMNEWLSLPIQRNQDGTPVLDEEKTFSDEGFIPDWEYMEKYISALPYGDRL